MRINNINLRWTAACALSRKITMLPAKQPTNQPTKTVISTKYAWHCAALLAAPQYSLPLWSSAHPASLRSPLGTFYYVLSLYCPPALTNIYDKLPFALLIRAATPPLPQRSRSTTTSQQHSFL